MINILIFIASLFISVIFISFFIYYLQIKEYRLDRFMSYLKEKGLVFFFLPERFYLPKKSVRNKVISLISGSLLIFYFLFIYFFSCYPYTTILYLLAPIISLLFVGIGVLYTARIVKRKRGEVIEEAMKKVEKSKAIFIGITGSFGKTSTKEFLYEILSSKFNVAKTDENYNTDIGVAISINKNLKKDTEFFITEVGAYKIGEIKAITDWVKPKYGIVTGLSNQHLSLFGSKENLIQAKSELLKSFPKDGVGFVNADSGGYKDLLEGVSSKVYFYSTRKSDSDIFIKSIIGKSFNRKVEIRVFGKELEFKTTLLGDHFIQNLLPCIGLALKLGFSKREVIETLEKLNQPGGRLFLTKGAGGIKFINDSYSSNVQGFLAGLEVLNKFENGEKVVVTKGIIELGKDKKESYLKILESVDGKNIKLITTDKYFKKLDTKNVIVLLKNESKISNYIKEIYSKNDTVLIEGRFSDKFFEGLQIK